MSDRIGMAVIVVGFAAVLGLAGYIQHSIWVECREAGNSGFYCLRMLSR